MIAESDNSKSRTTHKFNRKNRMNETMINYEVINEETSYSILGNSNIETNTSFSEYYVDHLNKQEFDGGNHVSEQREIDEQFPDYFR